MIFQQFPHSLPFYVIFPLSVIFAQFPPLVIICIICVAVTFYLLVALLSLWQYRSSQVAQFTPERFALTVPLQWRTFAYPLPGLRRYLFAIAQQHGMQTALTAIQQIQKETLQVDAAQRAIHDLANHPNTALDFCGTVATMTNEKTTVTLILTGTVGRSIAVLTPRLSEELEKKQSLELWIGTFPPLDPIFNNRFSRALEQFRQKSELPTWFDEFKFNAIRQADLITRLNYALKNLESCQNFQQAAELQRLLYTIRRYATAQKLTDLLDLLEHPVIFPENHPDWMHGGWQVLQQLTEQFEILRQYRELQTITARQEFLARQQEKLQTVAWPEKLPTYWQAIGNSLKDQWLTVLNNEFRQVKELLSLQIAFPQTSLLPGRQPLTVRITNPTSTLARRLTVTLDDPPDHLFWISRTMQYLVLEGHRHVDLRFECQIDAPDQYRIQGQLTATDLDDEPLQLPFSCQLNVAVAGKTYPPPPYQPYIVGAGLNNDRTFVGRTDLLEWLGTLWRQPDGKPAIVLVGQRRIGKTSLLYKIQRDGLKETQLLPIFVNIQELSSEYSFLNTAYQRMTTALNLTPTPLATTEPYEAFKTFLYQVQPQLNHRRFLLMLDEADLIPDRQLGDLLPGFLRSLMQQAEYPTLLLFCGTYRLKQAAWNYSSILFNTAQFKTVSYLTADESAEVLRKPVRPLDDLLEFDDFVLEQAFKLTHGQPLLLQSLGAKLIEEFNETVRRKEPRSTFVDLNDLENAAQQLAKDDNAAFLEHWIHADITTHRVLSVLAWGTDEFNRLQLDMDTIERYLRDHRLNENFPRKLIFNTVQRLVDEEILATAGVGYCFSVPLYRRWIQWKYPPLKIREEGDLEY